MSEQQAQIPEKTEFKNAMIATQQVIYCLHCKKHPFLHPNIWSLRSLATENLPLKAELTCPQCGAENAFLLPKGPPQLIQQRLTGKVWRSSAVVLQGFMYLDGVSATVPIYLVVEGRHRGAPFTEEDEENQVYFYEEHSCTSNFLQDVVGVICGGVLGKLAPDRDPHGLFRYVGRLPMETRDDVREWYHKLDGNDPVGDCLKKLGITGERP